MLVSLIQVQTLQSQRMFLWMKSHDHVQELEEYLSLEEVCHHMERYPHFSVN